MMPASANRRVLILGASGMMGNTIFRVLAESPGFDVWGTVRSTDASSRLPVGLRDRLIADANADDLSTVTKAIDVTTPEVVINCIGIVKQLAAANDPLVSLPINSILPHRLTRLLEPRSARLIQLSSDCVFDGKGSMYRETDFASADDLYGRSKFLGEVDYPNAITLRTSTIGHELGSHHGLLEWFLAQSGSVRGFRRAIYSGLSTVEFARVIRDYVIPHPEMHGLFHVSGDPINKFDLLALIRETYQKQIAIEPDDTVAIDRSLDSSRFRDMTGYRPPSWPDQIREMRRFA
jgi:dTDP-4-dehydrorhamnose reductase